MSFVSATNTRLAYCHVTVLIALMASGRVIAAKGSNVVVGRRINTSRIDDSKVFIVGAFVPHLFVYVIYMHNDAGVSLFLFYLT